MEGYDQGEHLKTHSSLAWVLIICAAEPRNTPFRVCSFFSLPIRALLMRIVQIFDYPGLDRTGFTDAVAEYTHSAALFISFVTIWCPPSRFANGNPSQSPFQRPNPGFRPVYQTYLPPCPAQNAFESDVGMAVVPVFNYTPSVPISLVPATETYANNPARGRYFNCSVNPHGSVYPYDPERLFTLRLLVGVDSQTSFPSWSAGSMQPYPR